MRWAREESGVDTVNDLVAWGGRQRYPVRSDGIRSVPNSLATQKTIHAIPEISHRCELGSDQG